VVKALTTSIVSRRTTAVWDEERQEWVPEGREQAVNLTPAALLVGGLLGLGAAAVGQRAIRTGTVEPVRQKEWLIIRNFAELGMRGKKERVWTTLDSSPAPEIVRAGDNVKETGRRRTRFALRKRDNVADYGPLVRGL